MLWLTTLTLAHAPAIAPPVALPEPATAAPQLWPTMMGRSAPSWAVAAARWLACSAGSQPRFRSRAE